MADNSKSKSILLKLETDARKATEDFNRLNRELKETKYATMEAAAAGNKEKLALIAKRKALDSAKEAQRKAAEQAKRYKAEVNRAKQATDKHTASLAKQKGGFENSSLAMGAYAVAIAAAAKVIQSGISKVNEIFSAGIKWEGSMKGISQEVLSLSEHTAHLIPVQALAKLVEYRKQLNLTSTQTKAISSAAVEYGRIAKIDFGQALQYVTDTVISGKIKGLNKLGIALETTGTTMEKQEAILAALVKQYNRDTEAVTNAGEAADSYKNQLENIEGRIGALLAQSGPYNEYLRMKLETYKLLGFTVVDLLNGTEDLTDAEVKWYREKKRAIIDVLDWTGALIKQQRVLIAVMSGGLSEQYLAISGKVRGSLHDDTVALQKEINKRDKIERKAAADRLISDAQAQNARTTQLFKSLKEQEALRKRSGKSVHKATKDEFTAHLKAQEEYLKKEAKANAKAAATEKTRRDKAIALAKKAEKKYRDDKAKADKKVSEAKRELQRQEIEKNEEMAESFAKTVAAALEEAKSVKEFFASLAAAGIKAIGNLAIAEGIKEYASGLGALARYDFGAAALHFASGTAWALIGGGINMGANALTSSASSGSSGAGYSASSYGSGGTKSGTSSSGSSSGGSSNVTNIFLKGRSGLVTRRDLKNFAQKLNSGRAA